jgi:hypothetical protein
MVCDLQFDRICSSLLRIPVLGEPYPAETWVTCLFGSSLLHFHPSDDFNWESSDSSNPPAPTIANFQRLTYREFPDHVWKVARRFSLGLKRGYIANCLEVGAFLDLWVLREGFCRSACLRFANRSR